MGADGDYTKNIFRVYDNPVVLVVCALFMPVVLISLGVAGMVQAEIETSIYNLWAPEGSEHRKDLQYKSDLFDELGVSSSSSTLMLALSRARDGQTSTRAHILEDNIQRMQKVESETKVTYDGNVYGWEEMCLLKLPGTPCLRMTAIDGFLEGGYAWGTSENEAWYEVALDSLIKQTFINYYLAGPVDGNPFDSFIPQSEVNKTCFEACRTIWIAYGVGQIGIGEALMDLTKNATCNTCMIDHEQAVYDALSAGSIPGAPTYGKLATFAKRNWLYFTTIRQALPPLATDTNYTEAILGFIGKVAGDPAVDALKITRNTSGNAAYIAEVAQILANPAIPEVALQAVVNEIVAGPPFYLVEGVSNPYNYQLGVNLHPQTAPRPSSNTTAANNEVFSRSMFWYDEGAFLPAHSPTLIIGGARPNDFGVNNTVEFVNSLEHVYPIAGLDTIRNRAETRGITLSKDQAKDILFDFKKKMEEIWTEGWDDDRQTVQYLAFSDDGGALGSFGRALKDVTTAGLTLSILSYTVIIVVTIIFLFNCNLVRSRVSLGAMGVLLALLAVFGGFGLTALSGVKFNIVQLWVLPFLLVGIGVDDMYVSTLAVSGSGETGKEAFSKGMLSVVIPISMTSFVNLGIFALFDISDIQAVYQLGRTAMYCIGFLYLTFVTSYPALLKLDTIRRDSNRRDILCCLQESSDGDDRKGFMHYIFDRLYNPMMQSMISHALIVLISIGLIAVSAWGFSEVEVGLDLDSFFEEGTQGAECMKLRLADFPVWPATMNWGELNYREPETQLEMLKIWEDVGADYYVAALPTNIVWTARYAEWGTNNCLSTGSADQCGVHFGCLATWVNNTKGLRNDQVPAPEGPGVCKSGSDLKAERDALPAALQVPLPDLDDATEYCPVFDGQTEAELAHCITMWANSDSSAFGLVNPGFPTEDNGATPLMPIRYSKSSADSLFVVNLNTQDDYVNMIEQTRAICDEHPGQHCWMSGIAYTYWEQYLELWETFALLAGCTIAGGWAFSFIFLLAEFMWKPSEACLSRKFGAASYGASIIIVVVAMSFVTTAGLCSALGVRLTVFTAMTYMMSVGFAVEYSVHITHGFLVAPADFTKAADRVTYTMGALFVPTFMAFLSSATGVAFMGGSNLEFVRLYFFAPLIVVILGTYFYGCYLLPTLLTYLGCSCVYIPAKVDNDAPNSTEGKE